MMYRDYEGSLTADDLYIICIIIETRGIHYE